MIGNSSTQNQASLRVDEHGKPYWRGYSSQFEEDDGLINIIENSSILTDLYGLGVGKETEPKTHVEEKYDTSPRDESSYRKEMHGLGVGKETEPKTYVEEKYDTSPRDELK